MDKLLQKRIGFLREELDNKQRIIDNLINLLNGVTTTINEVNFSCRSLQIKNTSEKDININETIRFNRFSYAQSKVQVNMAEEQLAGAPSDTSKKQNIEDFQNSDTASDNVNSQCNKSNLSPEVQQQKQEELNRQLKEICQQYHTGFHAISQHPKDTRNISLENETITNEVKTPRSLSVIPS